MKRNPLIIDIRRNQVSESSHTVKGMALDAKGVMGTWGDAAGVIYPRSTLKPIQALPLIETGAAGMFYMQSMSAFSLSTQELALACASHSAEPEHVAVARAWMQRLQLKESDFECGTHWPYNKEAEQALCAAGQKPCSLHNNCSGKHLGMLTACLHRGWKTHEYTSPDHPLQRSILETFAELAEYPLDKMTLGVDGCSAPNPALPLENIARAFLNLMALPAGLALLENMAAHPFFVAGTGRFDTLLMQAAPGKLVSKIGAEGSVVIFNLAEKSVLYLKCEDGNTRATHAAAGHVLKELKWLEDDAKLADLTRPQFKNWRGVVTGDVTVRI